MKKVLITGISGFVGKYLAEKLITTNTYEVSGTYRNKDRIVSLKEKYPQITFLQVELTNDQEVTSLIDTARPDTIFHLAAQTSPSDSFKDPKGTFATNINAVLTLLEALRKKQMQQTKLFVISTSEVYGIIDPSDIPVDEETPLRPSSPYAVSKIAMDFLGLQYFLSYHLPIVRLRPFNHIGPGQEPKFVVSRFAKEIAEIEKKQKDPVIKVGNLDGKRDFTDVRDVARCYELLIEKGQPGDVYNIGSGTSHKIGDVLQKLLSLSPVSIKIEQDPTLFRPSDIPEVVCDNTKVKNLTFWQPNIPFDQTLKDTLDYWRNLV